MSDLNKDKTNIEGSTNETHQDDNLKKDSTDHASFKENIATNTSLLLSSPPPMSPSSSTPQPLRPAEQQPTAAALPHSENDSINKNLMIHVPSKKDIITNVTFLPSSPTISPSPSSPRPARPQSATAAAPPRPPPPPIPFGPNLMMPPPPIYNQPMMMMPPPPPPHHFQFAPYGQPFVPYGYGYAMFPYPNPWTTGPFDCFSDAKNCCLTCCCPCVTFGQIAEILNEGQTPWWEHAVIYLVMDSITFSIGAFLCAWPYRVKMRTKYWLRGKLLWDFIFTFLCTKISLCQQYRQLGLLGIDVALGWEANREKMRIKAWENMYQMQHRQVTPPNVEHGMYR